MWHLMTSSHLWIKDTKTVLSNNKGHTKCHIKSLKPLRWIWRRVNFFFFILLPWRLTWWNCRFYFMLWTRVICHTVCHLQSSFKTIVVVSKFRSKKNRCIVWYIFSRSIIKTLLLKTKFVKSFIGFFGENNA